MSLLTTLATIGGLILALVLAVWRAIVERSGRKSAEAQADKGKDLRDANASVDRSRSGVTDRLRDGKF